MGKRKLFTALAAACLYATSFIGGSAIAATTADHNKEIVGYVPNWQAWKGEDAGVFAKGLLNQANIDYSQYTILNFSFFGVAVDGSLHSGDYRNKSIYKAGVVQQPAPLLHEDPYSSWDKWILYGELELLYHLPADHPAVADGYVVNGQTWTNTKTGESGTMPIPYPKPGGIKGLFDLAHENGKKVMASIGGWSMCKHFPEMAADATKKAKFLEDVKRLINMGFDGIDLDWEYPGSAGMNIENYSDADYANFITLIKDIRAVIGPDKLITSAFHQNESRLGGFNGMWAEMDKYMDFYNMMTYDSNGGWSGIAGHNSPVHAYTGQEWNMNYDETYRFLATTGIDMKKVNMGVPFYGRGVVTEGPADLNAPTKKSSQTVQPDGPISSAADSVNWGKFDGTPSYFYIKQQMGSWTRHWDDEAKVPYLTKGNYFLSYDDEESITYKAQYIVDRGLGGVIVWDAFGDAECTSLAPESTSKMPVCADLKTPLLDALNAAFAVVPPGEPRLTVAPVADAKVGEPVTINATATDPDGQIVSVEFFDGAAKVGEDLAAPYSLTLDNLALGAYNIKVVATDNEGKTANKVVSFNVIDGIAPVVSNLTPSEVKQAALAPIEFKVKVEDPDGTLVSVVINVGGIDLVTTHIGNGVYSATWTPTSFGQFTVTVTATDNEAKVGQMTGSINLIEDLTNGNPAWDAGAVYTGGDVVSKDGKCYKAKWWTQGEDPATSAAWEEVPCDGGSGDGDGSTLPIWKQGTVYTGGDQVIHEGLCYEAKWWDNTTNPTQGGVWKSIPCP